MRFLNLKLTSPDSYDLKIQFTEGINILSIPDKELFAIFKQIPAALLYGADQDGIDPMMKQISCSINASSPLSDREFCFSAATGDSAMDEAHQPETARKNDEEKNLYPERYSEIFTHSDFLTSSFFDPEQIKKNSDPVFEHEKIRSLIINNEVSRIDFPFFKSRKSLLSEKEKELTDLNRDKQLLELKKMKKEKLLKEINITERSVSKLEKRRDSILRYKTSLNDITLKLEARNRLSSKINNLKKDLIELREIKEKVNSVEAVLKEKFSHFSEKENGQIPDLEQIQESFNFFRDINEKIDKFSISKKRYSGLSLKITASMIIFSLTAFLFMLFTSSASFVLGVTSALSFAAAAITGLVYYFKIRKLQPAELLEEKKKMEISLVDLLEKNNFSVGSCRTGELYEILFQYFEDFINYRDVSYELMELKKKISNSASLLEKEKKLDKFSEEIENIDTEISETIENLDLSIHPRPEHDGITKTIHEIDELLEENGTEISEKRSLITKFHEEIEEYDRIENSSLSAELRLEEVLRQIERCRERTEHIKFLNEAFDEASGIWSSDKLEELSRVALEKFEKLTDNSFIKEEIADTIHTLILNSGKIRSEHRELKKYISFSIKAALSELLFSDDLPPVFIIDPFTPDNEFSDNMKKLLPEFFPERQVVVIIPGSEPDLKGNLITL